MVELQRVSVIFGEVTALRDVNLKVESGEFVFLVGSTGAGKSTVLRLLYGALTPTRGQVMVAGRNITHIRQHDIPYLRRLMGIVPQDHALLPKKRVWENVAYGLRAIGYSRKEVQRRVTHVLELVGMHRRADAFPNELSGGEAQRVAIARAIANNPPLLIADEPTSNLDPETSLEIAQLLQHINLRGATVLVSTHDHLIVDRLHKRVMALERGRILSDMLMGHYPDEIDRTKAMVRG